MKLKLTIGHRLVLAILALLIVAVGVPVPIVLTDMDGALDMAAEHEMKGHLAGFVEALRSRGRVLETFAGGMAALPAVRDAIAAGDKVKLGDAIRPLVGMHSIGGCQLDMVQVLAAPATVLWRSDQPMAAAEDISASHPMAVEAFNRKAPVSGLEKSANGPQLRAVAPVFKDGNPIGAISVQGCWGKDLLTELRARLGVDLTFYLHQGDAVKVLWATRPGSSATNEMRRTALAGVTRTQLDDGGEQPRVAMTAPINDYAGRPLAAVEILANASEYADKRDDVLSNLLLAGGIIILLGLVVATVLERGISRPLRSLTLALGEIVAGNAAQPLPGRNRGDEIGRLANAIDQIRDSGGRTSQVALVLDSVDTCLMVVDGDGAIVGVNAALLTHFQTVAAEMPEVFADLDPGSLSGHHLDVLRLDPAEIRDLLSPIGASRQLRATIGGRTFDLTSNVMQDERGERTGVVIDWQDVTHQVAVQNDIGHFLEAVLGGHTGRRLEVGDGGFLHTLCEGLNRMAAALEYAQATRAAAPPVSAMMSARDDATDTATLAC